MGLVARVQAQPPHTASADAPPAGASLGSSPLHLQYQRLLDASLPIEDRRDAADRLLAIAADADAATFLAARLAPADSSASERAPEEGDPRVAPFAILPTEAADLLLQRLAVADPPPRPLAASLCKLIPSVVAQTPPSALEPSLLGALARYRSKEVVGALIECLARATSSDRQTPVAKTLAAITGRDDLGTDPAAWSRWFEANRWLAEADWNRELADSLARQRDHLQTDRRTVVTRLVELTRTLYLTIEPGPERSARLAQLLLDDEPAIRQLGFDLASRELLAATGTLEANVGAAATSLLSSPDPTVRAQAANLLIQFAPGDAGEAITLALGRETSRRAAAALLPGVARWPMQSARAPVIAWLSKDDDLTRPPAEAAALALFREGILVQEHQARALDALRLRPPSRLSPAGIRLLGVLGSDDDRDAIAALIETTDDPARRRAAAEAIADRPQYLDAIVAGARIDTELFRVAVDAIARHEPTPDGFTILASLNAPNESAKLDALVRQASLLSPGGLNRVATATTDLSLRQLILMPLYQHTAADDTPADDTLACLLLLAETELGLAHPDQTLTILARIPQGASVDMTRLTEARAAALLASGQIDAGEAIGASAEAWIRALEISIESDHCHQLLDRLRARFADTLDPSQLARVDALAQAIAAVTPDAAGEVSAAGTDPPSGG